MITKQLFCANCQESTSHGVTLAKGEIIFTCGCGRFKKFLAAMTEDELRAAMVRHGEVNRGLGLVRDDSEQPVAGMPREVSKAIFKRIEAL